MPAGGQRWCWPLGSGRFFQEVVMSGSSFVVPSAVFSGVSALSGPVAVVGSRSLPAGALLSVARFGRWVGRSQPLWSGGALGVDSAASAGALAQGGQVCWWLPAGFGELAAGSSSPVVRGPGGVFPVSAPRQLARSVRCVALVGWAVFRFCAFQRAVVPAVGVASSLASWCGWWVRGLLHLSGCSFGSAWWVLVHCPSCFGAWGPARCVAVCRARWAWRFFAFVAGGCGVRLFRSLFPLSSLSSLPSSLWVRVRLSSRQCLLLGLVAIRMASGLILSPCVARCLRRSGSVSGSGLVRAAGPSTAVHVSHVWR